MSGANEGTRKGSQAEGFWLLHGGDTRAVVTTIARTPGRHGALFRVEMDRDSLERAREAGLSREDEAVLHRAAWECIAAMLPARTVGRRTMWSTFEYVLTGNETVLIPLARQIAATLAKISTHQCCWHLVFIDVLQGEPERTFRCDPGYELDEVAGKNAIAWVTPYDGDDWREARRYPTVTFH